jgi:WD40 repeat protein
VLRYDFEDLLFSPNGQYLAAQETDRQQFSDSISLWDVRRSRLHEVRAARGLASDAVVVTEATAEPSENSLLAHVLKGEVGEVYAIAFTPDSRILATSGRNGPIKLWDVLTGRIRMDLFAADGTEGDVLGLAFSPDGLSLAAGRANGSITVWSAASRTESP